METTQSDVQNRRPIVPITGVRSVQSLKTSGWLSGIYADGSTKAQTGVSRWEFQDQKAAQMYQRYAAWEIQFALEAIGIHILLVTWLAYNILQKSVKRAFDLLIVLCGLPLALPIMLLTAVGVKLDSPGPVFFRQQRVGKWGRTFTCYKFRSMCKDAEKQKADLMALNEADKIVFKMKLDPRITRVGRVIRKLSIDELPQILNVIKGDMSIIGPRPPVPFEVEQYSFDAFQRLDVIPGITGLQQVSGRSNITFQRWVELDMEYIRTQCLKKDIEILFRTIPAVISGKGAY